MRKRLSVSIRMLAALSMVLSMLGVWTIGVSAAPSPGDDDATHWDGSVYPPLFGAAPSDDVCAISGCIFADDAFDDGVHEVYFPAVGNADASTGLGAAQTSITVQNISDEDIYLFIYVGTPEDDDGVDLDNWDAVEVTYLTAGASKTFQASDLEIPAGEVRPVVAAGYIQAWYDPELEVNLIEPAPIAGVAKQAVTGISLPFTTTADSAVSGYNAIGGRELGFFDELYFPIVQTNCGPGGCWNSILRIANMGADDNAAVTVRFFPADDGSGSLQTGFQLQGLVDVGETWSIDLSEWVPEGWVGSAHVYTDDAVGAIVDRVKPGTNMWVTNTASNGASEHEWQDALPYILYAPDVRSDYNGWNTGINVANTVEIDAQVSIQYFGSNGNAPTTQTRRLAPQGMTYFYNPSDPSEDRCDQPATDVPGCEFIGGAVIISSAPLAVAVDGVKYFGNDANVGQAFSYAATGNLYTDLNAALVQKGNPANGNGATSGINFMNPNADAATVETTWLNPSGFNATNFGSSIVWVPGYATGFVYTMFHHNLPNGYVGSAIVNSDLPVVATTANVDYQVDGDGTAIWNLTNPCGFFRQAGECVYEAPLGPGAVSATITQQVFVENPFIVDEEDDNDSQAPEATPRTPLAGVLVTYTGADSSGNAISGAGMTNATGRVTFAVPAGTYWLTLTSLPQAPTGYVYTGDLTQDAIDVATGNAYTSTAVLTLAIAEGTGRLTKEIINLGDYTSLESVVAFCAAIPENLGDPTNCFDAAIVTAGYGELDGDADNTVSAEVPAGAYRICYDVNVWYDVNTDSVEDFGETLLAIGCETTYVTTSGDLAQIIVLDEQETTVVNDFDQQTFGTFNVFVRDDVTDLPLENAEVCIYDSDGELVTECGTTNQFGRYIYFLPSGTYTTAVSAEGYEQESTVTVYSPAADAADGGTNDLGDGSNAEVVIALDPSPAVLNIVATVNGDPLEDALVEVFDGFPEGVAREGNGCEGTVIASGQTDANGAWSTPIAPGTYCVEIHAKGTLEGTIVDTVTVTTGDPGTDTDLTVSFTADGCGRTVPHAIDAEFIAVKPSC